jgi:endonuclease/exonuclease/phosphatase (EEP) superfamily protein YafD
VVLLENGVTRQATLNQLKSVVSPTFILPPASLGRFQVFTRNADLDLSQVHGGERISLRRLRYSGTELLLGIVHAVDKLNWDQANQSHQIQLLVAELSRHETALKHDRTMLIGDFNMNPFDQAMNMATGMNAMMTVKCVQRLTRKLQSQRYRYFYNPMWNLFGDRTPGPAGTYYHTTSSQGMYGWNMLDQVLIRPGALPWFDTVEILTEAGRTSLQTKSERPDKANASDHFPLVVKLK